MSDTADASAGPGANLPQPAPQPTPDVTDPAKLIRLGTMLQSLLSEVHLSSPDEGGRKRLAEIHTETVSELGEILSEDLREELEEFNACCSADTPSESEIRVAQAQLVGWIQGLLRGMQASAANQAAMAQQQLMQMQARAQQQAAMAQGQGQPPGRQAPPGTPAGPAGPQSGYL